MRQPQTLVFVNQTTTPVPYTAPKWWDRGRWWLVRKLGGTCPFDTVEITRIPIDGSTFVQRLYEQQRALFDTFGPRPHTLLIGAEDYRDLMRSPDSGTHAFVFNAEVGWGDGRGYRTFHGLHVRVVPWLRGAVVMPDGY